MSLIYSEHSSTLEKISYSMFDSDFSHSRMADVSSSQFLENLCDYLYDDLRPRILHEPRITVLCDVCTVLQALMVLDVPTMSESEDEDEEIDELTLDLDFPVKRRKKGLGRLHISHLLQMVLQDAQTRLFFKAQSTIQAEIRYYIPKPEDLAYPDKLVGKDSCLSAEYSV